MEIKESTYKDIPVISVSKMFNLSGTNTVQSIINKHNNHIIIDLSGLLNMDSTAIGLIMRNTISLNSKGKKFALVGNDRIKTILAMAHLDDAVKAFNSVEEAYSHILEK
jgi:anti-anti-sigma factor